ncbi:unnamed protein product [Sphenostylis stenocarpa]|uniref:Uncharacterized protein n=1 Tax=Sphenostylis stenocarpa TaxID=92480 RepID=A0AA86RSM1_9FABA|nr:unnamed protein product [Sphenostylis stenocarpa]
MDDSESLSHQVILGPATVNHYLSSSNRGTRKLRIHRNVKVGRVTKSICKHHGYDAITSRHKLLRLHEGSTYDVSHREIETWQ